ncbi:MAG: NAD-dependent epimerase/dehydratase family protein [Gemmatimonadetes bacterium]|nr:NAD-dependent epimerase/dehydratase family protein [Gemmatimonadota bacterium]
MSDFSWAGRPVLVTGATGLVGSWLVKELLERDAKVVLLVLDADPQSELIRSGDLNRCNVVNGDLADFAAVERAVNLHDVDTVFHLGAQTLVGVAHRFPVPTFQANMAGTWNVMEAARQHSGLVERVVVASSDKAYGEVKNLPYLEDMPLHGLHPYEMSKTCTDLIAQCYAHTYDVPVTIARFGNVYGGGDLNFSRIVPDTIRSLHRGQRPIIRSDGTFLRDYVYVKDVARAYLRMGERMDDARVRGEAFNFSGEKPTSVLEMVQAIQKLMDRTDLEPDIRNTARGEIKDQYLDASKARDRLDWTPDYDLESGLRETIDWYRTHLAG